MAALFAFGTLLSWATSDLVVKYALNRQSVWFICFWGQLLGGVAILLLGFITGNIQSIPMESWGWVALLSTLNLFGIYFFYRAIESKGVALSLPIVYSWTIPVSILGMIFLHQFPSLLQWSGIGAAMIGIFLVSYDGQSKVLVGFGTVIAFISMLIWGLLYFLIITPNELYGEWWISGSLKVGSSLLCLPLLLKKRMHLSTNFDRSFWIVTLIGTLDAIGLLVLSMGLQVGSAAVVTGIVATTPAVVAFFGVLLFKEKINHLQVLGIVTTVVGLVLLVV